MLQLIYTNWNKKDSFYQLNRKVNDVFPYDVTASLHQLKKKPTQFLLTKQKGEWRFSL